MVNLWSNFPNFNIPIVCYPNADANKTYPGVAYGIFQSVGIKWNMVREANRKPPHPSAILQSDFDHVKILTWLEVEGGKCLCQIFMYL